MPWPGCATPTTSSPVPHTSGPSVSSRSVKRLTQYGFLGASCACRAYRLVAFLSYPKKMSPSDFDATNPNTVTFPAQSLGTTYNLCTSQRFRDDPTAAFCFGTLI